MAPKRSPSPSSPGSGSGSGSSGTSSSEEEEEEEEEEQQQQQQQQQQKKKKTGKSSLSKKPLPKKPSAASTVAANPSSSPPISSHSGSEDDEDEEEGSDRKVAPAEYDGKPPPSRRRSPGPDLSKKAASEKPKPPPASEPEGKKKKKKRKEPEAAEEEEAAPSGPSGKKPFQRVWTEEDEIALLKGMIGFQAEHGGADPASSIDAFRGFISKSLHSEFTKTQLSDKMRRLRDKYQKNLRRGKNRHDPPFASPHEQAAFELSKKIWQGKKLSSTPFPASPSEGRGGSALSRGSPLVDREAEERRAGASYPTLRDAVALLGREKGDTLMAGSLWKALELLKPAKAKSLEERWSKHVMAGMKYSLERSELEKDLMKSLVEALNNA